MQGLVTEESVECLARSLESVRKCIARRGFRSPAMVLPEPRHDGAALRARPEPAVKWNAAPPNRGAAW